MTSNDLFERQLPDSLAELAEARVPSYLDDILAESRRTRQRPAWTFIERWLPMIHVSARSSTAPPMRAAWMLLLIGLLTVAFATSLAIVGSQLLRDSDPTRLDAMVPSLALEETWDATTIPGISAPVGLDVGPDGNLYIVNAGSHEIIVVDASGIEVRRWGEKGSGDGQFLFQRNPTDPLDVLGGVAVGPDGSVYVADMVNDRVQQFTAEGDFVRAWGSHGPEDGQFLEPFDIAVGPDGSVFVVDDLRDDIQRFSPSGTWLQTTGRHGAGPGEMNLTGGIDVDSSGHVLNADYGNQRIQAWDEDGTFMWSRGGAGVSGALVDPVDIAAGPEGYTLVADEEGIKVFDSGSEPRSISTPTDWRFGWLAANDDGIIYASSVASDQIHRISMDLQEPEESTPAPADALADASPSGSPVPSTGASGPRRLTIDGVFPVPFSAQLPSTIDPAGRFPGWREDGITPGYASFVFVRNADQTPAYVNLFIPAGIYADPCHPEEGLATLSDDPSVDELVEALSSQVGMRAGPITDVTFGRYEGKIFDLDNNIDERECTDAPWLRHWTYRSEGLDSETFAPSEGLSNSHKRIAIVDVEGMPVLIEAWDLNGFRDEVAEMYQLFESIEFE